MHFLFFGNLHPFSKLIFLSFIALASFLLFLLLALVISVPIFGIDIANWAEYATPGNPDNIAFMRFFQGVQSIGMFIVPAGIAAYLFSEGKNRIPSYFNYKKPKNTRILGLSILLIFVSMPAVSLLGALNADLQLPESMAAMELKMKAMETQAQTLVESFLITDSTSVFIANLLIVAVIPAIGEELLFRGTIQRILGEWFKNKHVAIITTAALFSFIHFQFYGFLPRMVLGIIFGYLFIWSKNIFYPILAHFINNALGVTAYFYMTELKNTSVGKTLEIGEQTSTIDNSLIIVGMISLGLIGLILYTIRKEAPEPLTNQPEPEES